MRLKTLVDRAMNKDKFLSIADYTDFCLTYLEFIKTELQAIIVSQNENHYRFFQYKDDGTYNVTRPINSNLMLSYEEFEYNRKKFTFLLNNIRSNESKSTQNRTLLNNYIYTCQQSIGSALDALPANKSNIARKINGDLFERFIRLIIAEVGIKVSEGITTVPVSVCGAEAFQMKYQHDLIIKGDDNDTIKAIGSVKTSSKDRIDKVFMDKFLYNRLTDRETPHFAIFLNDVQRKGREGRYGVSATFLPGHFKGYTIKLNPLDGVYYFDIRPNMKTEEMLKNHIKTFDHFLTQDVWSFT